MPQEEKKHISTTTGLLIILAAAVIIGGGAIAYFYAQSPTSWDYMGNRTSVHKSSNANTNTSNTNSTTTDWKTYTNSTYGFSFKYPKDWVADDSKTTFPNTLLNVNLDLIGKGQKNQDTDYPGMASVNLYESINKLDNKNLTPISLKDYLDKYAAVADPVYSDVNAKTISGLSGYTAKMGANQFGGGSTYFVKLNNGNILEFRTFNTGITTDQIVNILSTFQFTQ